jgi:8-oxo-dGTP pyrophosphatase MutT (NUDIX family)
MARDGSQFLNAHVFPGGQAEDADAGNIQRTALRELYEEAAIHLRPSDQSRRVVPKAVNVNTTQTSFTEYLQQTKEVVAEDKLILYSRWITPKMMPKRFDTTFLLALAMPSDNPVEGKADAQEIRSLTWMSPSEALSQFSAGKITLFPPQWYYLPNPPQMTLVN